MAPTDMEPPTEKLTGKGPQTSYFTKGPTHLSYATGCSWYISYHKLFLLQQIVETNTYQAFKLYFAHLEVDVIYGVAWI